MEEAAALPALARYAAEPHTPTIESSTYEDLLATAILNKVGSYSDFYYGNFDGFIGKIRVKRSLDDILL